MTPKKSLRFIETLCLKKAISDLSFRRSINENYFADQHVKILVQDLVTTPYLDACSDEAQIVTWLTGRHRARKWFKPLLEEIIACDATHAKMAYADLEQLHLRDSYAGNIKALSNALDLSIADYQSLLTRLYQTNMNQTMESSGKDLYDSYIDGMSKPPYLVKTGFRGLDKALGGGLYSQRLHIIGARTGVGKSSLCIELSKSAMEDGAHVIYVSLEMSYYELSKRFMSAIGVDQSNVDTTLTALKHLNNVTIYCKSAMNVIEIEQAVRSKLGSKMLVVVDYIGLVDVNLGEEPFYKKVGAISKYLYGLSKTYNIPIVAAAQLKRPSSLISKNKEHLEPDLSDLKDSGELEQDADVVLLLHRPDMMSNEAMLFVKKNRHGPCAKISLQFDKGRFFNHKLL